MSFLGVGDLLLRRCPLLQETLGALDPDNVFGAAACGHRCLKLADVGSRESVNSQSRRTRNEAHKSSEFRGAGY
jgi:hypothetical protein